MRLSCLGVNRPAPCGRVGSTPKCSTVCQYPGYEG